MRIFFALVLILLWPLAAPAAEKGKLGTLPEPPPPAKNYKAPPPATEQLPEETIPEPDVVITTRGEDRYEEYRIAGRLYMIKVTPKIGKPYYLVDNEGRGDFSRSDSVPRVSPPMWVIKRF